MVELSQPKQNSSGVEAHGRVSNSPNYLCHLKTWKKIQCHFENMEENSASLQDAFERFRLKRKVEVFTPVYPPIFKNKIIFFKAEKQTSKSYKNSALLHFRTPLGVGLGLRQSFQQRFFMIRHQ